MFFNMPFDEAIAFFKAKKLVTPEEFDALVEANRRNAFIARKLLNETLVKLARTELQRSIDQGGSFKDFAAKIRAGEALLGTTPSNPGYIQTLFRTNVLTAYSAGKHDQGMQPSVLEARPLWLFRATGDTRTRGSHQAMHNKAFFKTSPFAERARTPLYYNCRCSLVSISEETANERGIEIIEDFPEPIMTFADR